MRKTLDELVELCKRPRDRPNKGGWGRWIPCVWKSPSGWSDSSARTASHVWWWCQLTLANDMNKHGGIVLWHRGFILIRMQFVIILSDTIPVSLCQSTNGYAESQGVLSVNAIRGEMGLWSSAALLCLSVSVAVLRRRCSASNLSSGVRWSHGWKEIKPPSVKIWIHTNEEYFTNGSHKDRRKQNWKASHLTSYLAVM